MKIGAGGLQGILAQEAARGLEYKTVKTPSEEAAIQSEDPNVRRLLRELNKAVERMRQVSNAHNQPLDHAVQKAPYPRIKARDRRTGAVRYFTLEEAEEWLAEMGETGKKVNGYV